MRCTSSAVTISMLSISSSRVKKRLKVHLLARQVGHAAGGGFQAQHERTLQMVLGAAQFFVGDPLLLEQLEFLEDRLDHLARGLDGCAGVDREAAGVAIRIQFGEHSVGQPLPLADILEQARTHAAAEHRVQHVAGEAVLMRHRIRRHAQAEMHLLERFLVAQRDARVGRRASSGAGSGLRGFMPEKCSPARSVSILCVRLPAAVMTRLAGE